MSISPRFLVAGLAATLLGACGDDAATMGTPVETPDAPVVAIDAAPDAAPIDAVAFDAAPDACPNPLGARGLDGDFVLGARITNIASVDKDAAFFATVEYTAGTDGAGNAVFELDPLRVADRRRIGQRSISAVAIDACGVFSLPIRTLLPAEANPVLDTDATLDVVLTGHVLDPDFACGTFTGTAITAIEGTFALRRMERGGELPPTLNDCSDRP